MNRKLITTLAAVALGACVLEKHVTLDRSLPGPDHRASLEPAEFAALVTGIRTVEGALGNGRKEPVPSEAEMAAVARKSLVAARHIPAGSELTQEMLAVKRPGTGLSPAMRALPTSNSPICRLSLNAYKTAGPIRNSSAK